MNRYRSWAYDPPVQQSAAVPAWACEIEKVLDTYNPGSILPFGNGRSYGDSCLNQPGYVLDSRHLNHIRSFSTSTGELVAESGCTFRSLLSFIVPKGWFLPVTPGTSFVTLGGAIANDVHGKNHHCDGTIGRFVQSFRLVRSSGEVINCSPTENVDMFAATIGGLGLTGFITHIKLKLTPISSAGMNVRVDRFKDLDHFYDLSEQFKSEYQYTVAWLDCAASGDKFARGVFLSANHSTKTKHNCLPKKSKLSVPVSMPSHLLNQYSIRVFNSLYYWKHKRLDKTISSYHYEPYFYPLDSIKNWNRIYGRNGFYQYQFVVPISAKSQLQIILHKIVDSGMGSFLAVLKEFGDIESPGMLSFPRPGYCLALDFANRGAKTEKLIHYINELVAECGGAAYPAKDRLMSADSFDQYFPRVSEFEDYVDSAFCSDFWRRVRG